MFNTPVEFVTLTNEYAVLAKIAELENQKVECILSIDEYAQIRRYRVEFKEGKLQLIEMPEIRQG